jgi:putative CocE/NonD family hydrolase
MSPRVVHDFPRRVRRIDHTWIPLSDGTRLSARIWLPDDADADPVPAILEYLPYRKGDTTAADDAVRHPYFAGHGYAAVRVDIRGSGDSEGLLDDEYSRQEHDDALEVLRWIAAQPWCTGAIGMMGISWGGFNSLQVAARRPPELKAIITACSTDDRYADDVHYIGGSVLAFYLSVWASVMLSYAARPPDPATVGERWREMWMQRLEAIPFLAERWLQHQRRDDYWKHGSVGDDPGAIECAVYAVGGWGDGYTDAIFRMLERLSCPRKALVGPWEHLWPEEGYPGPAIGFLQEALRWWDHWLKGIDSGIMDEPQLRFWMQDSTRPARGFDHRPGRWAAEQRWPSGRTETRSLAVNTGGLAAAPTGDGTIAHSSPLTVGADAGSWLPYGNPADLPGDQRHEDAASLAFDSEPLEQPFELLGNAVARLAVSVDRPSAFLAVRLCEVLADGASLFISRGILNLTHRDSHEVPEPLEPGRVYQVAVPLKAIAHSLAAGSRLRLAISTSYWPWVWPSPEPVTVTVHTGAGSSLELPVRPPRAEDAELPEFGEAEISQPLAVTWLRERVPYVRVSHDHVSGVAEYAMSRALSGAKRFADGLVYDDRDPIRFTITDGEPLSATVTCERTIKIGRGDWQTRIEMVSEMTSDAEAFTVSEMLDVYEGAVRCFALHRSARVPRDHG